MKQQKVKAPWWDKWYLFVGLIVFVMNIGDAIDAAKALYQNMGVTTKTDIFVAFGIGMSFLMPLVEAIFTTVICFMIYKAVKTVIRSMKEDASSTASQRRAQTPPMQPPVNQQQIPTMQPPPQEQGFQRPFDTKKSKKPWWKRTEEGVMRAEPKAPLDDQHNPFEK